MSTYYAGSGGGYVCASVCVWRKANGAATSVNPLRFACITGADCERGGRGGRNSSAESGVARNRKLDTSEVAGLI